MIISASRRTDIAAFYSEWFINRIRKKYCCVVNPFNTKQVSYVSLDKDDVDILIFWTKNPLPLMRYLDELDSLGYKYYFQYTLTGYSKLWEPHIPDVERSIETFIELSERVGSEKVIWRYDPIILSNITDYNYHYANFIKLADKLKNSTHRVVISVLDDYRGARGRINELKKVGVSLLENAVGNIEFGNLIKGISEYAKSKDLEMYSCAEPVNLEKYGVLPGKCVDDKYIKSVFNLEVSSLKDKNQRKECGCVQSKDIGVYDSCLHGCKYCYANRSDKLVRKNNETHNPESPSLLGWHDCIKGEEKKTGENDGVQISLI